MTNKTLLTNNSKVSQVEQIYYSPVAILPPPLNVPVGTTYCFLSHIEAWPDDANPPAPADDELSIKNIFKSIFVAKLVTSSDISPVIQRIDWTSGLVYDYYRDNISMFQTDAHGSLLKFFYVRNRYDQVFKCLWNNSGAIATSEPFFQPGSYGTNNIYKGADGYKWKYMYTIDVGTKQKFMDSNWMPVPVGYNTPNPLSTSAGFGDIEVINITNTGSGYNPSSNIITIQITGDGTGAVATADVSNGHIMDIVVTNPGTNYSYANITINTGLGSGAVASAAISPIGGHGFDPISELGCTNVMLTCQFNGDEGGIVPVDIDFRQVGLIISPMSLSSFPNPAAGPIYKVSTDFIVAGGFGLYTQDEVIYQGASLETATFSASSLSFDTATNRLHLINIKGTPTLNAPVFGSSSHCTRTLLSYSSPDFQTFSGYLAAVQNRSAIQRSSDGIEQFRFILGF